MLTHLEEVGEHDLETPDDHDPGGAGQGDGLVEEADAKQPDNGLGGGQRPGHRGPGGEQRLGLEEAEAEDRDTEATETEPEHQHSRVDTWCPPEGDFECSFFLLNNFTWPR